MDSDTQLPHGLLDTQLEHVNIHVTCTFTKMCWGGMQDLLFKIHFAV